MPAQLLLECKVEPLRHRASKGGIDEARLRRLVRDRQIADLERQVEDAERRRERIIQDAEIHNPWNGRSAYSP